MRGIWSIDGFSDSCVRAGVVSEVDGRKLEAWFTSRIYTNTEFCLIVLKVRFSSS
jgi:hypothetical protein